MIHIAVLSGVKGKVAALIEAVVEFDKVSQDEIYRWVNSCTTAEQFTPLHLASFKSNIDAIETLITYGADPHAKNILGLNMLHVAAQGDSAVSLYYFKKRGVDIDD